MSESEEFDRGASFEIEGPDENGCAWICALGDEGGWRHNLGPAGAAADAMVRWLHDNDFGDRGYYIMRYVV